MSFRVNYQLWRKFVNNKKGNIIICELSEATHEHYIKQKISE